MPRTVGIGHQDFEQIITTDNFYIDKTGLIKKRHICGHLKSTPL